MADEGKKKDGEAGKKRSSLRSATYGSRTTATSLEKAKRKMCSKTKQSGGYRGTGKTSANDRAAPPLRKRKRKYLLERSRKGERAKNAPSFRDKKMLTHKWREEGGSFAGRVLPDS